MTLGGRMKNCIRIFGSTLVILLFFSCMTVPKESSVPENLTPAELNLRAQEAYDIGNKRAALFYYNLILKRFCDDESICIGADFEIAHIRLKQKKWQEAYMRLQYVLNQYEGAGSSRLPPEFYKLALIDMKRVEKKVQGENTEKAVEEYIAKRNEERQKLIEEKNRNAQESTDKLIQELEQTQFQSEPTKELPPESKQELNPEQKKQSDSKQTQELNPESESKSQPKAEPQPKKKN